MSRANLVANKKSVRVYLLPIRATCPHFDHNNLWFLCGLVVRVLGYRSGGPGSIPGTTRFSGKKKGKNVVGLERGPLSLVSTN
jgi:hypothetical protein